MVEENKKQSQQNTANAGEYYVASRLSAENFVVSITLGRAESYDILAVNPKGKTVKLQVKTMFKKTRKWQMNEKHEKIVSDDFYYAFVSLNEFKDEPDFWIVPSEMVSLFTKKDYEKWVNTVGIRGQDHNPGPYRSFKVYGDQYTPKRWNEEYCKKFYKNIELIK